MTPFEQNWFRQSNLVASDPETVRNLSRYQSGDKKNERKRDRAEKNIGPLVCALYEAQKMFQNENHCIKAFRFGSSIFRQESINDSGHHTII